MRSVRLFCGRLLEKCDYEGRRHGSPHGALCGRICWNTTAPCCRIYAFVIKLALACACRTWQITTSTRNSLRRRTMYANRRNFLAHKSRLLPLSRVGVIVSGIALLFLALAISGCSIGPLDVGDSATPVAGAVTAGAGCPQPSNTNPTAPPATPTPQTRSITGKVTDAYSGQPVASAEITAAGILTETTGDGSFSFDSLPLTFTMTVEADGSALTNVDPKDSNNLNIKLRPNTLSGRVPSAA